MNLEDFKKDYHHEVNKDPLRMAQLIVDELDSTSRASTALVEAASKYLTHARIFNAAGHKVGIEVFK